MKVQHIQKEQTKAMKWASGTTTELFVYPETGNFLTRDFVFRISTATVEAEETTFSDFSGLTRILMPLEGSLTLIHEGRYVKKLNPFEQDTFDGAWKTKSIGKVRDFNVMFKPIVSAGLEIVHLNSDEIKTVSFESSFFVVYVNSGSYSSGDFDLKQGDLLVIEGKNQISEIVLKSIIEGELLIVKVILN